MSVALPTMAAEAATTPTHSPTRRLALQDISVNVVVHKATPSGALAAAALKAGHPAQPEKLAEVPRAGQPPARAQLGALRGEARLGGQKRVFDLVHGARQGSEETPGEGPEEGRRYEGGPAKRKRVEAVAEVADDDHQPDEVVRSDNAAVSNTTFFLPAPC